MTYRIAVARGDGVGPEVVESAVQILNRISEVFEIEFEFKDVLVGGAAYDVTGNPLPEDTLNTIKGCDSVLFGAVGGDKWDDLPHELRPEAAILGLRKALKAYSNLRPGILYPQLKEASPLKNHIVENGFDICVVRELTGGIYFGRKRTWEDENGERAEDVEEYSREEIERIARKAFHTAMKRRKKVTSVDKANVLHTSRLWRKVVEEIHLEYPQVELNHMYIDNACMQAVRNPSQFDVILTSNIFGDILSDEISMLTGSIGLLPSASMGDGTEGIYEPIHGSAPDLAGLDRVNPIGTILSASMMLEHSLGLPEAARSIEDAVKKVFEEKYHTEDVFMEGGKTVGTKEITRLIAQNIEKGAN
ncbi:3-isopropylmalate dehydrogenase [Gudongella sp. SC589]|jgi:3-isopropylmalate dehydrogenase|uniref:3-isopropylmalate dehydrogenase n=1 Tax=Gudongella sp. SC589 TaxID=3385990 RepID=UPI00390474B8